MYEDDFCDECGCLLEWSDIDNAFVCPNCGWILKEED